jgi:small ligand-binding sensory domain FIST
MPFVSALSQHPDAATATGEAVGHVMEQLDTVPDLAVVFCSAHHLEAMPDIASTVRGVFSPRVLLGASAGAVLSGGREVEDGPALSVWAAGLPSVPRPVRVTAARTASGTAIQGLPLGELPAGGTLVLLADPFSLPVDEVLEAIEAARPGVRVAGGFASAAHAPGGNRLMLDGEVVADGGVGVVLDDAGLTTIVSQGCRPIGDPMIVTAAEGNVIAELAGRPALERVAQLATRARPEDRTLLASGLHLGVAIDEHKEIFSRGDFLVRNIMGADRKSKAVVAGQVVPVGTTVQFQVRDAASADEDLHQMLAGVGANDGALVFTCNGRGRRMFGEPDHDARVVHESLGTDAIAGMFCAGELGPVGGRSFVHGFTASIVLFQDP